MSKTRLNSKKSLPVKGALEAFFETGTEGVIWSLFEDEKEGYEGLHCLNDGDILSVWGKDGKILWQGAVELEWKRRYRPYPSNPKYGQQEIFGMWVRGFQKGLTPTKWAKMFFEKNRAELIPKRKA